MTSFFEQKSAHNAFSKLSSAHLKIFMSYLQLMQVLVNLELAWSSNYYAVVDVQSTISGAYFQVISLECVVDGEPQKKY